MIVAQIQVITNGTPVRIHSSSISAYGSQANADAGTSALSLPLQVNATQDLYYPATATTATVVIKDLRGRTISSATYDVTAGTPVRRLSPLGDEYAQAASIGAASGLLTAVASPLVKAESYPRMLGGTNGAILTSQQLFLMAVPVVEGQLISAVTFVSATTAADTPLHQVFTVYSSSRVLLGASADATTAAWAANTAKTLSLATPFTTTYTGFVYAGLWVQATAVPTLRALASATAVTGIAPILCGTSGTASLTDTPPDPAGTITATSTPPYVALS